MAQTKTNHLGGHYEKLPAWHSLKITFANGTTTAYVDNVSVRASTNAPVHNLQDSWTLTLGNFDGDLDEVRISNIVRPEL